MSNSNRVDSHMAFDTYSINDLSGYTNNMATSMYDKLWFLNHFFAWDEIEAVLDYGCADGVMIEYLHSIFPGKEFYGYDISNIMINLASERCNGYGNFSTNLDCIMQNINPKRTLVILNSIVHEIYSYSPDEEIQNFWTWLKDNQFRAVALRDMACLNPFSDLWSNESEILNAYRNMPEYAERLADFEQYWGNISTEKLFIKWLLCKDYVKNWDREMREEYLPLSHSAMIYNFQYMCGYDITYNKTRPLPYIQEQIFKETGHILGNNTHTYILAECK